MIERAVLGLDFGTLSVRCLTVDADTGDILGEAEYVYPAGVMEKALPDGTPLPEGFALVDPEDAVSGMLRVIPASLERAGIAPERVIGLGLDCTSSTVLPLDASGVPLCRTESFRSHPHAWAKLWKHHGAYPQSLRMLETARRRGEGWLELRGGGISCELMLPKALETAEEDPEVWQAAARYVEMGDYLTQVLTGLPGRSLTMAGCNSGYQTPEGYPSEDYWREVSPRTEPVTRKLRGEMIPAGGAVGPLRPEMAVKLGLRPGVRVAPALIDSHASALGCGADRAGDLVAVLGTSACYLMNAPECRGIPGIYSVAFEANAPGLYGYEGGQSCLGNGLDWFVRRCVPEEVHHRAAEGKESVHALLSREASRLAPGGSGLMALDWLDGVRTPLMRPDLTGVVVGLTLHTTPAEMYRAAVESCCYGARRVVSCYGDAGLEAKRFLATGGIPGKNPFLMQTLSDVCGMDVQVCSCGQASALGAAIAGAAASGECGGLKACVNRMAAPPGRTYHPENAQAYEGLYRRYLALSAVFEQKEGSGLS